MEVGLDTLGVMKSIKQALDPYWIMNPGKIVDVPTPPSSSPLKVGAKL